MPADKDRASQFVRGSFASWKFKALEAMSADPRLKHSDFKVGFILMSRLSQRTMRAFPSQAYLSRKTSMSERNVAFCLARLRSAGWLRWARGNRQQANEYEFDRQTVADAVAALETERELEASKRRSRTNADRSDQKHSSGPEPIPTGNTLQVATGNTLQPNTYEEQGKSRKVLP